MSETEAGATTSTNEVKIGASTSEAEIGACISKMNMLLDSLNRIREYAKECLTSSQINVENIHVRMKRAGELLTQYLDAETKMVGHKADWKTRFLDVEDTYYAAIGDFNEVLSIRKQSTIREASGIQSFNSTAAHNLGMIGDIPDTKLPKLEIPKFSGNYGDWQSFFEMFTKQINDNSRLSDVQKFYYLKGYLTDEAANLVKHMQITSANYAEALDKLRKRFDRKRYTVNSFIRRFMEQPQIQQANSNNMRKIHDVCDEVIRGLKSIGADAESRDPWLVYLVLNKLDDGTKCEWAEYSAKDELPSFTKLLEFLSNRIDALESYGASVKSTYAKSGRNVKSFATASTTVNKCELCKMEHHKLYECTKFKELSVIDRRKFITDHRRCFNCLNLNHNVYNCKFRGRCQKCYRKHHSLLHEDQPISEASPNQIDNAVIPKNVTNYHCAKSDGVCILPTVMVKVKSSRGTVHVFRALLDSASEVSFVTEKGFKRLDLVKEKSTITIKGLGSTYVGKAKGMVKLNISNDDDSYKSVVNAYIVPYIATILPKSSMNDETLQKFKSLKLADPDCLNGGDIDMLLGSDIFFDILCEGKIQEGEISACNTKFGWIRVGKFNGDTKAVSTVNLNVMMEVDCTLKKFWEIENIPKLTDTLEIDPCEQSFVQTTNLASDNKFIVRLPFKIQPEQLGSTYHIALKRLESMERRFQRDETFKSLYHSFMTEYEELGHMKRIGEPNPNCYYMPHHGVLKQNSTTRLRVVFDGSTKSTTNFSLTEILEIGPSVQSSLVEIILRFRQHKYVLSGDIEKMYRMIWINEEDAKFQQILWRTNPNEPPQAFQLRTVAYGTSSASFLSTRCIKEVANRISSKLPKIANVLSKDVYVDVLMCGASTISELISQKELLVSTLSGFGFNLRKFRSNNLNILSGPEETKDAAVRKEFSTKDELSKVFGLIWDSNQDEFSFSCELSKPACLTKRGLLSDASKMFDPLGWVSPVTVKIKIIFQRLWLEPITWDDALIHGVKEDWLQLRESLSQINQIKIPRWLNSTERIILFGFCDASESAYSAVIYAVSGEGVDRKSTILIAKTKVAPIDQITLARLELQAAHMLTQLMSFVEKTITMEVENITLWTDSKLVLDWLSSLPKRWKTFVANRTSYILSHYKRSYWQHVASQESPADCATRGLSIEELIAHKLWWMGPDWIRKDKSNWPIYNEEHVNNIEVYEERSHVSSYMITKNEFMEQFLSKYSSSYRTCYNLAVIIKCVRHLVDKYKVERRVVSIHNRTSVILRPTLEEIQGATYRILLHEQQKYFAEEYKLLIEGKQVSSSSDLKTLNPFIHEDKLIRVGGRITNSTVNFNTKHPILISNQSIICKPLVRDYHELYGHASAGLSLSLLRRKYWILKCKNITRLINHKCIKCFRAKPKRENQLMGDLPSCRVQFTHAFSNTGIDYCGPFEILITNRRGQPTTNVYVCLFVCLATKAVHTEVVTCLSTDGFVAALQRFVSRRGLCQNIYSDNGTNFVGANNQLKELYTFLKANNNQIYSYLLRWEIKWHFIPPGAPHMGGIWEASVKLLKTNMKKVASNHTLSLEEFTTLTTRIEASINSRPLYVESDGDMDVITPAHFIIGRSLVDVPEVEDVDFNKSAYSRWKIVKQIYQHFWKRWHRDYITTLQRRTKWFTQSQNIQIGDIVLVIDDKAPSCHWPLARVINVHPGRDGLVRVITLKISGSNTALQRPITKICKIPIGQEDELNQSDSGRAGCYDQHKPK